MKTQNTIPFLENNSKVSVYPPPTTIRVSKKCLPNSRAFKPTIFSTLFVIFLVLSNLVSAQTLTPPAGKIRGMYVSCGDVLMDELANNSDTYDSVVTSGSHTNLTPNMWGLINYCKTHYVKYIAVYGLGKLKNGSLDANPIVGNPAYFNAVKTFIKTLHGNKIKVGIVITNKDALEADSTLNDFVTAPFYYNVPNLPWDTTCVGAINRMGSGGMSTYSVDAPPDSLLNPGRGSSYSAHETAEMLKQVMRVLQYSYEVRDGNGDDVGNGDDPACLGCGSRIGGAGGNIINNINDSAVYLFDYMSLEYEYWDSTTFMKAGDTLMGRTPEKAAWNKFFTISQAMVYVYGRLCTFTKMELELRLVPPHIYPLLIDPNNPGDMAAQDMLPISMQVEYLSRAFNRLLVSDYKSTVTGNNMISKTAATHTKFSDWPNDINNDSRHKIMPVFSAATYHEKKHCFGEYLFDANGDTARWGEEFFGHFLSDIDTSINNMHFFEQLYLTKLSAGAGSYASPACNEYFGATPSTCTLDTSNSDLVGFMWYNYSMLSNPHRSPVNYQRNSNQLNSNLETDVNLNYNLNSSELKIFVLTDEPINMQLQLFNLQGTLIFTSLITRGLTTIDLSNQLEGVYLCQLNNGKTSWHKKIIKLK